MDDIEIYVDGVLQSSLWVEDWATSDFSYDDAPAEIGRIYTSPMGYHVGAIDDVRLYDVALTPEEVEALYAETAP